jgi:hypothetical protein
MTKPPSSREPEIVSYKDADKPVPRWEGGVNPVVVRRRKNLPSVKTAERRKLCREETEQDRWALVREQDGDGAPASDLVPRASTTEAGGADSGEVSASGALGRE